ncbi:MAG: glycosyltransferase [Rhodopila sp.]
MCARPGWGRQLRRLVLLAWWAATFQLHVHARYWLRARRLRRDAPAAPSDMLLAAVDPATLVVPLAEAPLVSIIVPTYGQVDYTLRCLASIARAMPEAPIEVLVVDDAYPFPPPCSDEPPTPLHLVRGIRLICNETNLGYLRSCNKAAQDARGSYLYLLNNDTQVLPGWLDPMLAPLRARSDAGVVGAKLLYPEGTLQEAGGIIWRDASGWNFGGHEDPSRPVYNYVREVDYCSGAALLIERDLFLRVGGFDERYVPANLRTPTCRSACGRWAGRPYTSRCHGWCTSRASRTAATPLSASSRIRSPTASASSRPGAACWRVRTIRTAGRCCAPVIARCTARSCSLPTITCRSRIGTPAPAP